MAKIVRYAGNLRPFADDALTNERYAFGTTSELDSLTDNINADFWRGWRGVTGPSTPPEIQDFNAVGYVSTLLSAYLHQVGVPEWDAGQEYHVNSFVNYDGKLWRSTTDNNVGVTPADYTVWRRYAAYDVFFGTPITGSIVEGDVGSALVELARRSGQWSTATPIGSALTVAAHSVVDMIGLTNTRIAAVYGGAPNEKLVAYDYDGNTLTQVGNALSLTGIVNPTVGRLGDGRVAVCDSTPGLETITTYDFDGTNWAQVGNQYAIGGSRYYSIAGLSNTDAIITGYSGAGSIISRISFDGTDWSTVRSNTSVTLSAGASVTAIGSADSFVIFSGTDLLFYRDAGVVGGIVKVGDDLSIAPSNSTTGKVSAIGDKDVAVIAQTSGRIAQYKLSAISAGLEQWTQSGGYLAISGLSDPAMCMMNGTDLAVWNTNGTTLSPYRLGQYSGLGPFRM